MRTTLLPLGLLATLLAIVARPAAPSSEVDSERRSEKAEVVLGLIPYVEWPRATPSGVAGSATGPLTATTPLVIGVLGDERFAEALRRAIDARGKGARPVRARSFRNLDEVDPCPILVIGKEKARNLPAILDFLSGSRGIVTVGDSPDFAESGGVVRLLDLPDRIGFEVNRDAARRADLRLSSQLLRIAERLLPPEAKDGS